MGKRINTLNTASSPANDDYLPIDGATNGTRKISADFVNNLITDVEVDGTSVVTSGVAEIDLSGKQDTLTAGSNITIAQDGTISATDTTYTAGTNVDITGGVISATDTTYTAGTNVTIDANNVISASDTTYSAGTNVQINNGVISATDTTYSAFGGATAGADGSSGLVPQPLIADKDKFLKGDGTWDTIQPGASALDDLTNVDITSPTNGQVLKYDSTNQEWVNANESGGGGGSTVTITPTLSTGTKIADYSIDGTTGALYAPNGGGGSTKHYLGQLIERVNAADSRITCSSENSSYPAWCAFNGISPSNLSNPNANTCWLSIIGTSDQTPWIKYHFDDVRYFTKLELKCFSNFSDAWVGDIQVLGSNDDVTYTNILASGNTYELTAPLCVNTVISIDLDDTDTWQYIKILSNDPTSVGSAPSLFIDEIYVYGGELQAIPENLGDLQNVTITSPTDGQGLIYDATNQIWVNGDVSGGSCLVKLAEYSGSGSGYVADDVITLSEDMTNYDVIMFATTIAGVNNGLYNAVVTVNDFINQYTNQFYVGYAQAGFYSDVKYLTNTTIKVLRTSYCNVIRVYGIKLANGGGNSFVRYSTSENVVGTWIDGSPVYEKTYYLQNISSDYTTIDLGVTSASIDLIWVHEGFLYNSTWSSGSIMPYTGSGAAGELGLIMDINKGSTNITMHCRAGSLLDGGNAYVTFRYTKASS